MDINSLLYFLKNVAWASWFTSYLSTHVQKTMNNAKPIEFELSLMNRSMLYNSTNNYCYWLFCATNLVKTQSYHLNLCFYDWTSTKGLQIMYKPSLNFTAESISTLAALWFWIQHINFRNDKSLTPFLQSTTRTPMAFKYSGIILGGI